jgi:hypothetical protein
MRTAYMKTRIVFTKIWKDTYFANLNQIEQLTFLYLITNDSVGLTGIYELDDRSITSALKITQQQFNKIKEKFMVDNKFSFFNGWIKVINHDKYNNYSGIKNEIAVSREISLISQEVIENLDRVSIGYPLVADTLNNHKSEIINQKSETINQKSKTEFSKFEDLTDEVCQDIADQYQRTLQEVLDVRMDMEVWIGKSNKNKYSNYKLALMKWVRDSNKQVSNNFKKRGGYIDITE